ncbi:hypothetical protein JW758_05965 [Candidatus Peregrinibacteria bacterium]|nr:hypothetical protein [Candidatus Peregrinibacteria bacterium]
MEFPKIQDKFKDKLQRLEARLESEKGILMRHEVFYERNPLESRRIKIERKKEQIEELESQIILLRGRIEQIIDFNPAESQYTEVSGELRKATGKEWQKIPNSVWKTMQDLFAVPGYRMVPKSGGIFEGDLNSIPLDSCVIDPNLKRSAYRFVREFGLAEIPNGMTSFQKMQAVMDAKPEIVDAFEHLKPMSPFNPERQADNFRLLVFEDYKPEHDGKILAPIFLGRQSPIEDRKVFQTFDSIYPAHRKALHAKCSYQSEAPKIFGLLDRINTIREQTVGLKKGDRKRDAIVEQLGREIEILEGATNHFKAEAGDLLKEISGIKDSLGRHNPGITCTKLVAVLNRLTKRLPQIKSKAQAMSEDEQTLYMRISRGEEILNESRKELLEICAQMEAYEGRNESGELFQGYNELRENTLSSIEKIQNLSTLKIRPFNLYAKKILEHAEIIRGALDERDIEKMRDSGIKAYILGKIFKVQQEKERILQAISLNPNETDINVLVSYASDLDLIISKRQVYEFIRTDYEETYEGIQAIVGMLVKGLRVHKQKEHDIESKKAMFIRLQKYLEELDFQDILNGLN